jgi:ubiquinone/menaquinone biosynthesis C-methylase UbiE
MTSQTRPQEPNHHQRVARERAFHDALITGGQASIATKEWWETPGGTVRFARRISMLKAACASRNNSSPPRILVIGCGDGQWVNAVSEFADVTGIDVSPEIVKNATEQLLQTAKTRVEVGDVHCLRFPDNSFDICFANSVLHHLELPIALPEIQRVLRPGGKLVAGEPNKTNPQVWWMYRSGRQRPRYGLTPDEEAFTRRAIAKLLRCHFSSVSVSHFDFWHPRLGQTHEKSLLFRLTLAIEKVPLLKQLSGSLWIEATKQCS